MWSLSSLLDLILTFNCSVRDGKNEYSFTPGTAVQVFGEIVLVP